MATSKRKRPATPRQGATDQRGNLVAFLKRERASIQSEMATKMKIPGLLAAHRVLELKGMLVMAGIFEEFARESDDRARARKGGL